MVQEVDGIQMKIHRGPPSPKYKTVMRLYIPKVLVHHFGVYACKAKNPRGDTDGIITLSERPSLTTRPPATTSTATTKITTMTTIQDWKKSDMYGSHLNEFEHDFQSNRKNKNRKKQQEEYNRYETTSRYDSDHLFGNSTSK